MFAVSLLGSVKKISLKGDQLTAMRKLATGKTHNILADVFFVLTDIAELLHSYRPFRLKKHPEQTDRAVRHILNEQYESEAASRSQFKEELIQVATDTAGVLHRDSYLFVPLGTSDPEIKNWWTVFDILRERLDVIIDSFAQIKHRLAVSETSGVGRSLCENVIEMIIVLQQAIERIIANSEYVQHRSEQNQNELLDAVERKTATFTGDTDA